MKKILFSLVILISTSAFSVEDVCCIMGGESGSGDSVQTYARIMSSADCKSGGMYQGRKVCAAVADPENTYCSSESSYQDRCSKCGYFWSGKECLTTDPKEKAKKELKEEEEKKKAAEKAGDKASGPTGPKLNSPEVKAAGPNPDDPKVNNARPEDDSMYNRRSKGITNDVR